MSHSDLQSVYGFTIERPYDTVLVNIIKFLNNVLIASLDPPRKRKSRLAIKFGGKKVWSIIGAVVKPNPFLLFFHWTWITT